MLASASATTPRLKTYNKRRSNCCYHCGFQMKHRLVYHESVIERKLLLRIAHFEVGAGIKLLFALRV